MKPDFQFSLYDFFGFLFPGCIFLAGMSMIYWSVTAPEYPFALGNLDLQGWVIFVVLGYMSGHIASALENRWYPWKYKWDADKVESGWYNKFWRSKWVAEIDETELTGTAKDRLCALISVDNVKQIHLFRLFEAIINQGGNPGDREIYQYREGFYRSVSFCSLIAAASILVRVGASWCVNAPISFLVGQSQYIVKWQDLAIGIIGLLAISYLSLKRQMRFSGYRHNNTVFSFLAFTSMTKAPVGRPGTPRARKGGRARA
jgi:hypothetical protein